MPRLLLQLFGRFQVMLDGAPITRFRSVRAQALLAYLAMNAERAHTREVLATLLWPDEPDTVAKQNLRQAIYQLRQLLDVGTSEPFLLIARDSVQFNPTSDCAVDVWALQAYLSKGALAEAVALYSDALLTEPLLDIEPYNEWLLSTRERLHLDVLAALQQLTQVALTSGDTATAQRYARRQLALEPWREVAHQQLMQALALAGDRSAALAQYEVCRSAFQAEFGAEPDAVTQDLAERIRQGGLAAPESASQQRVVDWGLAPSVSALHGRTRELADLTRWLIDDRCKVVAVIGMGGLGKTTLTTYLMQQLAAQFEVVIWRSLLNAPPLVEILQDWLRVLIGPQLTVLPDRLDAQLGLLFEWLRRRRCLLILDNAESILQAGEQASQYLPSYETYGRLIKHMGETQHQSCLVITSRELPHEIAQLERSSTRATLQATTRTLQLSGLSPEAGQTLLQQQGFAQSSKARALVQRYSGHPLALLLIAETIAEVFEGDIELFLSEAPPVFDDIRDVLDQQFARLTALERDILLWLAIEREAVGLVHLSEDFIQAVPKRNLLEALNSLRRRSLLEREGGAGSGLMLQSVVAEYLMDYLSDQVCDEIVAMRPNLLKSHALLKAQSKEYIRVAQMRLTVQPIINRLDTRLGRGVWVNHLQALLAASQDQPAANYLAGNIINMCLQAGIDLRGWDFARLSVREADLRGQELPEVDFSGADLTHAVFTDTFSFVFSLQFSPDGNLLAAGTSDGEIRLMQVSDGQLLGVCRGHTGDVWGVAFSPDGTLLASASEDMSIRVWEVHTCQCRHVLQGHTGFVWSVAFSPDGRYLASGSRDQTVGIWDIGMATMRHQLRGHTGDVMKVAFGAGLGTQGAQSVLISAGQDQRVCVWDGQTFQQVGTLSGESMGLDLALHPSSALVVSGSATGELLVWDLARQALQTRLRGHEGYIRGTTFSADGRWLISAGIDRTVRVWDTESWQVRFVLQGHEGVPTSVAIHPNNTLIASSGVDHCICYWDAQQGKLLNMLRGHLNWLFGVAIEPAGRHVASAVTDHSVRWWDTATGRELPRLIGHNDEVIGLAFSPDGRVLASGGDDFNVHLWDVPSGQARAVLRGHTASVRAVDFSPSAPWLATASYDQTVRIWDIASGQCLFTLHGHRDKVRDVAFSPDGNLLVSGGEDQCLYLWVMDTKQPKHVLSDHSDVVTCVAYHPNGDCIVSGSWDQSVCIWDVRTGQLIRRLSNRSGRIWAVAISPDGRHVLSAGDSAEILVWNISSGQLERVLVGHTARVWSLQFDRAGQRLVSSSTDRTVKLWDVSAGADAGVCQQTFQPAGPYAGMDITSATGISLAQRAALKALGAIELESAPSVHSHHMRSRTGH